MTFIIKGHLFILKEFGYKEMKYLISSKENVHPLLICLSQFQLFSSTAHRWLKVSEWSYSLSLFFFCTCLTLSLKRWDHLLVPFIGVIQVSRKFCLLYLSGASVFWFLWNLTSEQDCNIQKMVAELIYFRLLLWWFHTSIDRKMKKGKECVRVWWRSWWDWEGVMQGCRGHLQPPTLTG